MREATKLSELMDGEGASRGTAQRVLGVDLRQVEAEISTGPNS